MPSLRARGKRHLLDIDPEQAVRAASLALKLAQLGSDHGGA